MSVVKKIPQRKCIGCNTMFDKSTLIRVVRTPESEIVLDFTGKRSGRGAYICKSVACFNKARKAKRLSSALSAPIPDEVYDKLAAELSK